MRDEVRKNSDDELTIKVPRFLQRWINRIPKSLWRAVALFFSFGVGVGLTLAGAHWAISWYEDRPLPPKAWPTKQLGPLGITAELKTEWNDGLKCNIIIRPSDPSKIEEFARMLSENRYNKITISLYNSTQFQIWTEDQYIHEFTRVLNREGKPEGAVKETCLSYLPRGIYSKATSWEPLSNLHAVASPPPSNQPAGVPQKGAGGVQAAQQKPKAHQSTTIPLEGDDVISGYSVAHQSIETSGGLTFFIYKDGEQMNAIEWGAESANIHYQCDEGHTCTLRRRGTAVVLHAKLGE